jgi:hypothetical protein
MASGQQLMDAQHDRHLHDQLQLADEPLLLVLVFPVQRGAVPRILQGLPK